MLLMQEGYEEEIARLEAEKKALEEQGKQLMLDYQNEKKEHQNAHLEVFWLCNRFHSDTDKGHHLERIW